MKTKWIVSMPGGLLPFLLAAVFLPATTACSDLDYEIINQDSSEHAAYSPGNYTTQNFWVSPEGSAVNLFDGAIEIIFPEGAVPKFTEFTMTTFPAHYLDLDGYNLYCWGFSLQGDYPGYMFPGGITPKIRYDMLEESWLKDLPASEKDLRIYRVSPTPWSYEKIVPFKACSVDCNCNMVKGIVGKCGYYVVGEK